MKRYYKFIKNQVNPMIRSATVLIVMAALVLDIMFSGWGQVKEPLDVHPMSANTSVSLTETSIWGIFQGV